jgi:hypothetical protein
MAAGLAATAMKGGRISVTQVAIDAFGNALGQGLVEAMTPATQGVGPWSDPGYRNGADIEDDNAVSAPTAGSGLRLGGGSGTGLRLTSGTAARWADDLDRGIRDKALALSNFDAAKAKVWGAEDAQARADARAALVGQNARADAYGRQLAAREQQWINQDDVILARRADALLSASWDGGAGGGRGFVSPGNVNPYAESSDLEVLAARVAGGVVGAGKSILTAVDGVVRVVGNSVLQIGDILTGGVNHDSDIIQQAWVEQDALGTGIVRLFSDPSGVWQDIQGSMQSRMANAEALRAQGRNFEAAVYDGELGADVGQAALGAGALGRTTASLGARAAVATGNWLAPELGAMAENFMARTGGLAFAVDPVQARLQELIAEGHGVQRHGAQVTGVQLEGRAVEGLDPMTGIRVDGVHGGTHQYAQHATKVVSDEAYVFAENYGRSSQQFIDATTASTTGRAQLEIPLKEIYGDDFRDFVSGVTRYGPKAAPTGFGDTIFSNDAYMIVRYKQNPMGGWDFNTMFPQPE